MGHAMTDEPTQGRGRFLARLEVAHVAAWDAGNRSMRAAGRAGWDADDYDAAVRELDRLLPDHGDDLMAATRLR